MIPEVRDPSITTLKPFEKALSASSLYPGGDFKHLSRAFGNSITSISEKGKIAAIV